MPLAADIAFVAAMITMAAALVAEANRIAPRGSLARQLFRFVTARRVEYNARGWQAIRLARVALPLAVVLVVLSVLGGV